MLMKINTLCKKIGKDISIIQKGGAIETQWPFLTPEVEKYIGSYFIDHLNFILEKTILNYDIKEIAKQLKYPSMVTQYIILIHSAKVLPLNQRIKLITNLIKILEELRVDYLCNKGVNKLKSFDITKYLSFSLENDPTPQRISSILYSYVEKLYPTLMRLSFEHHGPYIVDNKKYIVKEYFNLKNQYLDSLPVFNFNNIKVIEEIEGSPEIDFFGHSIGDYKIIKSLLVVDDKIIINSKDFFEKVLAKFIELDKMFLEYKVEDYAKNLTYGLYFSLKPLTNLINIDWKPIPDVINKLDDFKLFFPKDKVINYIKSTDVNDIEKKIYVSFNDVFIKD